MEVVIFIGIQASGKSTFYKEKFFKSHMRISLDMLRTRNRENIILDACLLAKQPFVVDNTNPTAEERKKYIEKAKKHCFKLIGFYFNTTAAEAIIRNQAREGKEFVPAAGIFGTHKKLQLPGFDEGFDELYEVSIGEQGGFIVEKKL